jgi:hypothetical protein
MRLSHPPRTKANAAALVILALAAWVVAALIHELH